MSAEELKAQGNKAFSAKEFDKAIELFTKAIEVSPTPNHVLYSNRSACYTSIHKYNEALKDAQECVKINPTWAKGYNRVGAAQFGLKDLESAKVSYEKALDLDPSNKIAEAGLQAIVDMEMASGQTPDMGIGKIFSDPNLIEKLKANPKSAELMKDPEIVAKVRQLQANPTTVSQEMFTNPKLMQVVACILGVDLSGIPGGDVSATTASSEDVPMPDAPPAEAPKAAPKKTEAPKKKVEEVVPDSKKEADELKAQANALYKKKHLDEAIELYNKAWDTHKDITYLNNRAAAEFEKGEYDTAIATCKTAVDEGREMRADYKLVAKSFARMAQNTRCFEQVESH
ncbi:unnamed protein product [Ambrosiozyma monospora]|uniref:Unnamed protein product n=1 Tax=Ambrosiozyma monospora TaxID=43982 RepID=A0ACB5TCS9_AMBMO|nr:unnamed protein product [Ambrosiozyma monospora]